MKLPDELQERVKQLQRDTEIRIVDGVEYSSREDLALRAAEIALEWAMEPVCTGCGTPYPHKNGTWCETSIGSAGVVTSSTRAERLRKVLK